MPYNGRRWYSHDLFMDSSYGGVFLRKRVVVRVIPKSFEDCWQESLKAVEVNVPKRVPETSYTPVNHNLMPFSIIIDLTAKRVVRRIVGIVPNSLYNGPPYKWDEFLTLLHSREAKKMVDQ